MRLRQAVIAARDLAAVAGRLRGELGLSEPYADPGVGYFGLGNAVFTLGDTFLEVVSPERENTSAGRLIDRRGGDCGYMLMFQVDDLPAARARARQLGIREVFAVEFDDIAEVHLHPADIGGAIVSLSAPQPPAAWRWGGPGWESRAAPVSVRGATVAAADPDRVAERWTQVLGEAPSVRFVAASDRVGLVEIELGGPDETMIEFEHVRVVASPPRGGAR
ncbi:MAG TPA: VOC family protein [Solirubrobacteraceae bacterium]|nr:VOC family protein [Solirubrobacteraceae bacterium]